jgi:hypothetical protein
MSGATHRDGRDAVGACALGGEVGGPRADDLTERSVTVDRQRRAIVAHHLGPGRGHDRAASPPGRVLHDPAQAVRRVSPDLGAHEQLGDPVRVGRPRAHAFGERVREFQRGPRSEPAHAPRSSFPVLPTPAPPPLAAREDIRCRPDP